MPVLSSFQSPQHLLRIAFFQATFAVDQISDTRKTWYVEFATVRENAEAQPAWFTAGTLHSSPVASRCKAPHNSRTSLYDNCKLWYAFSLMLGLKFLFWTLEGSFNSMTVERTVESWAHQQTRKYIELWWINAIFIFLFVRSWLCIGVKIDTLVDRQTTLNRRNRQAERKPFNEVYCTESNSFTTVIRFLDADRHNSTQERRARQALRSENKWQYMDLCRMAVARANMKFSSYSGNVR